jgi:hypothetical protein
MFRLIVTGVMDDTSVDRSVSSRNGACAGRLPKEQLQEQVRACQVAHEPQSAPEGTRLKRLAQPKLAATVKAVDGKEDGLSKFNSSFYPHYLERTSARDRHMQTQTGQILSVSNQSQRHLDNHPDFRPESKLATPHSITL